MSSAWLPPCTSTRTRLAKKKLALLVPMEWQRPKRFQPLWRERDGLASSQDHLEARLSPKKAGPDQRVPVIRRAISLSER